MADTPISAYSPWQSLASLTGPMGGNASPASAAGTNPNPSGVSNMVAALIRKMGGGSDQGLGTFEGNVASPANPLEGGTYGMPATSQPPAPPMPQPPGQQSMPANPFRQGAPPTPFLNGSALFGQPPTA